MRETKRAAEQHFFIRGNRHDKDRIEVQIGFDGEIDTRYSSFEFDTDFILIAPRSFGLSETDDIDTIREEFQSYLRLHTQIATKDFQHKTIRVQDSLNQFSSKFTEESLRHFALEIESFIKNLIRKLKKLQHSSEAELIKESLEKVKEVYYILLQFRNILKGRGLQGKKAVQYPSESIDYDILLLNEYLSHHYVALLVNLDKLAKGVHGNKLVHEEIVQMSKEEAQIRKVYALLLDERDVENQAKNEERYIRKINLLKKYFQRSVFINTKESSREKKLLIPVYGVSAALAATWAILIQIYQMGSFPQRMGFNTIAFVMIAVFAYVIKDIMKDSFRKYFYRSSQKYFPNYVKKLYFSRGPNRIKLGSVKEFLKVSNTKSLPEHLKSMRHSLESYSNIIDEDALIYRKRTKLNLSKLKLGDTYTWGLREVIRIKFDRYMSRMDDSHIDLNMLSPEGIPIQKLGHKVYHIYLGIHLSSSPKIYSKIPVQKFKLFRISLDKNGVIKCKTVEKNIRFKESTLRKIF